MYDLPELQEAHDAWWAGLAGHIADTGITGAPGQLSRQEDPRALWRAPDLLLAQCCGYDLRLGPEPRPRPVATPHYALPGCAGPDYCSFLVVRADDPARNLPEFQGRRAAVNMAGSHSGQNVLRFLVAWAGGDAEFFGEVVESGGHRASLALLREEKAEIAAVDCVTFGLIARVAPAELAGLRLLARSPAVPGLPYVSAPGAGDEQVETLARALEAAVADPALSEARAALAITGFSRLVASDYDPLVEMAEHAEAVGVPPLLPTP